MKKAFISAAIFCLAVSCTSGKISLDEKEAAATALCERLLGEKAARSFEFRTVPSDSCDRFRLYSDNGKIVIEGNDAGAMATGLNYYLKYRCNISFGFYKPGSVELPSSFPSVDEPVEVSAACEKRFFLNYCTFGYSMPWWGWEEWEYFIDWMALNGINLPLAITGQEAIWYRVWSEMGMTDEQIRSYFTGPSHLPWHRMSNIDKWGGPLPKSWLDGQEKLQKQIVSRERELGMTPVLPAFSGHVPEKLGEIYPGAKIDKLGFWGGFSENEICSFLDPSDSLFSVIQKSFLEKEIEIYGTDHVYGIDLFNEVTPPSWEPEYLAGVGKHYYETLKAVDEDATWLQMGWLFYHQRRDWTKERVAAYITSYPAEHSILLDYYCDNTEVWRRNDKFSGVPFIWCYLGNFGGNTMLWGKLSEVSQRINATLAECDNVVGIGSTLEGLDVCNYTMYDYVLQRAWNIPETADIDTFISHVADSRCGFADENARKAWKILLDEVYSKDYAIVGTSVKINARPSFVDGGRKWTISSYKYSNDTLLSALKLLLEVPGKSDAYEFDIVNLARQWLGNLSLGLYEEYCAAYAECDREKMDVLSGKMLELIEDLDKVVSCREEFSLGKWIADARKWGADKQEADYFERNARNLITTWGRPASALNDYANRTLAGLTTSFYGERWKMFFAAVNAALDEKGSFTEEDYKAYYDKVTTFEGKWWEDMMGQFSAEPSHDAGKTVSEIVAKWGGETK